MHTLRNNKMNMITLDVRISCDTFWNYKFNIPIRIDDYYNPNDRNINRRHDDQRVNSNTCEIGDIGRSDPLFIRLEEYLVEYVIQYIYDDLIQKGQSRDIPILLKKARKFHIHGRTPENIVYICTHC